MKLILTLIFTFNAFAFVSYPKPTGPFQVGVKNDIPVSNFIVSIYYPAEVPSGGQDVNELASGLVNSWQGLFDIANDPGKLSCGQDNLWWLFSPVAKLFEYSARAGTYFTSISARPGLPVLGNGEKKFPVVLFSHGYASFHAFHLALIQDIVSHGFIVVGIDHTCSSDKVRLEKSNARVYRFREKYEDWVKEWSSHHPRTSYDKFISSKRKEFDAEFGPADTEGPITTRIREFDQTLDFLNNRKADEVLFKAMRLDDVAIVGQSRGAVAAVVAMEDLAHLKPLKAVVALDAFWGISPVKSTVPTLVLGSASSDLEKEIGKLIVDPYSPNMTFEQFNVEHHEFSDVAVFTETGEPNFHERYSKKVVDFLTRHLYAPK